MTRSDLDYIRQLNDLINGGLLRIAFLRQKAIGGAIRYDDTGSSKPAPDNKIESIFCQIDKEERRVNGLIEKRYALKTQAVKEIQAAGLEIAARHILYLRYLATHPADKSNLEWSEVIYFVNKYHNIQRRKVFNLHHDAVAKLESYRI